MALPSALAPMSQGYEVARPAAHAHSLADASPAAGLDDLNGYLDTAATETDATVYDTCYVDDGWMD
jgi:hypothetical protein